MHDEVIMMLCYTSKACACLRLSIFHKQRNLAIKEEVYCAVVMATLLYGAETWTGKADSLKQMKASIVNRCIRSLLGVSKLQHWHIGSHLK